MHPAIFILPGNFVMQIHLQDNNIHDRLVTNNKNNPYE